MNSDVEDYLCTTCGHHFTHANRGPLEESGVREGEFSCRTCGIHYPVIRGIPRFVPPENYAESFGYQWNIHHHVMDSDGNPLDTVVHASAGFPATTPWVAAAFKIGLFGRPYKDVMRQFKHRAGAFIFEMKPTIYGRIGGTRANPVISYPIATTTGLLESKTLAELVAGIRQVASVYKEMGAYTSFPNGDDPDPILEQQISLFITTSGALHPQGTCRAGSDPSNSVVDTNGMSWDVKNLMCCDASIIPNSLSSNPNATIMAIGSRAADFVNKQILGATSAVTAEDEFGTQKPEGAAR